MAYHRIDDLERMMEMFEEAELLVDIIKSMSNEDAKKIFDNIHRIHGYYLDEWMNIVPIEEM